MDKPISFSANIYKITKEYIEYDKKATGFGFSFGKNFSEYWWGDIAYNFENATIYNISEDSINHSKRSGRHKNHQQYYSFPNKGLERQLP